MSSQVISTPDLELLPLERATTIPAHWYHDPEIYKLELDHIFSKNWHFACFASELDQVGAQHLCTIAGEPIIVVRGKAEKLRAFYNVCRHRGGPLATEDGCTQM